MEAAPGLQELPQSVLELIFSMLMGSAPDAGGVIAAAPAAAAPAPPDSPRALVQLAFSCKGMLTAAEAAEPMWRMQCQRLGWRCAVFFVFLVNQG